MEIGLYDQQGILRFAGRDGADCRAYAELFALEEGSFSLESLRVGQGDANGLEMPLPLKTLPSQASQPSAQQPA